MSGVAEKRSLLEAVSNSEVGEELGIGPLQYFVGLVLLTCEKD